MTAFKVFSPSPETQRAIARGLSASLAGFALLNLFGETVSRHFAGNVWWIDLRPLPAPAARALLVIFAGVLLAFAIRPAAAAWRRYCTAGAVGLLGLCALWNALEFFALLGRGRIHSGFPLPMSLCIFAGLVLIFRNVLWPVAAPCPSQPAVATPPRGGPRRVNRLIIAEVVLACCVGFPLAQMLCFGQTDYRRPADVIVVFGARTYADGSASQALADRVRTACELYHQGLADKIVFSGGPGDGPIHETQAMRHLALQAGIPETAIFCDPQGLNTAATVGNTVRLFRQLGVRRVLAVSHAYHLPRVKMAYLQQGWDVSTVPARETRTLRQIPFLMAREVVAFWAYYLRPLGAHRITCAGGNPL
jgi:vancomycin permeability regulator SanA